MEQTVDTLLSKIHKLEEQSAKISSQLTDYNTELEALQKKHNYNELRTEQKHLENDIYVLQQHLLQAKAQRLFKIITENPDTLHTLPIKVQSPDITEMLSKMPTANLYISSARKNKDNETVYTILFDTHSITVPETLLDNPSTEPHDPIANMLAALTNEQKRDIMSRLMKELSIDETP